jgi:hypothetical protein
MTTATWVGGSGNWSDAAHWSGATGPDGIPDFDQDVVIPAFSGQSVTVTLDVSAATNSLSVTGDSLLHTTTLALGEYMISVPQHRFAGVLSQCELRGYAGRWGNL